MRYLGFCLFCLLLSLSGMARVNSPGYDSVFIADLSDSLALRIYGINKFNGFNIRDNLLGEQLDYAPNRNLNLDLGGNYKWFGLGVAVNLPFLNNDNEKYGKTNRLDLQTNIFTRKFLIDFYGQFYKGFYIENPQLYLPQWESTMNYPQRKDVSLASLGGSMMYIFNHEKYSARAAFVQTEIQKKSAGSFLLGGFFTFFSTVGDSAFIPKQLFERFSTRLRFRQIGVANYGVSVGYTHTFVFLKNFYFSLTLIPGIAVSGYRINYDAPLQNISGTVLSGRFLGRMAFGYNSERSFGGFIASADSFTGNAGSDDNNQVNFEVGLFRFFYGRRINFSDKNKKRLHLE